MDRLQPPKPLIMEGNLLQNWKLWKQEFNLFMVATECTEKSDQVKTSFLLHCIGEFEAYFGPRKNVTFSRFKFFTYRHELGQSFDDYHNQMRKLSTDCELLELRESLLKDVLIIGLSHKNLQEHLLRENNVSLDRTLEISRTVEITRSQANITQNGVSSDLNVDEIRKNRRPVNNPPRTYSSKMINKCKFCSYSHKRGSCPAYGKLCNNCKKGAFF